ncbi:MAG: DUF2723 domain-containing protein [Anaerolineae bacterium]|nr:DUF2723 domain-containing protein [Anaerolineae bacterium]
MSGTDRFRRVNTPVTRAIVLVTALGALLLLYAVTLQTHISGSFEETTPESILKNEYIKDVAEIQVALNVWGTIHHTGYPLFAILGNIFTAPLRLIGIEPAAAASLYALAWGLVTLGTFGLLLWQLTGNTVLAVLSVLLLGTARSIWIHHVLAEVYSMSLAVTAILLLIALWPGSLSGRRRLYWLAFAGGIGVSHHRAVAFVAPGLIVAVWPYLRVEWRVERVHWLRIGVTAGGLALVGFLPYIYLPLREWGGGNWVYGEPGTLSGFWTEFTGREADRLVKLPANLPGLWDNITSVWTILVHEITLPGLLVGIAALGWAVVKPGAAHQRRAARIVALCAAGPTLFAIFYHTAVLPEAILMPTVLALVLGVALTVDGLRCRWQSPRAAVLLAGMLVWAGILAAWHYNYVDELVTEPSGVQTIERINTFLPRDSQPALMLPWGPRYAAAVYSQLVTGENDDIVMVDHKGDYRQLLADGYQLYTEPETFYTYAPPWNSAYGAPSGWWTDHLGRLYLTSAAPHFVQLGNVPWLTASDDSIGEPVVYGITRREAWLTCDADSIFLHVIWGADNRPDSDPSIFVHLTGDQPAPNPPNADSRHPVYGLYPFARWSPGEIVRDDFILPRLPGKPLVRFGLYEQDAAGQFVNYGETTLPVAECLRE